MNKKSLATACVLATAVFAAAATPAPIPAGSDTTIGPVDYTTDFLAGPDQTGFVTYKVAKGTSESFTDTYDFSLAVGNEVTAYASVPAGSAKSYALTGNSGELQLYAGSLSTYKLVDQVSFGSSLDPALVVQLAPGNYFFAVEGTTAGAKGGTYRFEVTAVPEPANAALLLAGLCIVGTLVKRRRKK